MDKFQNFLIIYGIGFFVELTVILSTILLNLLYLRLRYGSVYIQNLKKVGIDLIWGNETKTGNILINLFFCFLSWLGVVITLFFLLKKIFASTNGIFIKSPEYVVEARFFMQSNPNLESEDVIAVLYFLEKKSARINNANQIFEECIIENKLISVDKFITTLKIFEKQLTENDESSIRLKFKDIKDNNA